MRATTPSGIRVLAAGVTEQERVLTRGALDFVAQLQREFGATREALLSRRAERRAQLAAGGTLSFPPETAKVRRGEWTVAPAPNDLTDRRVEITGPVDRKMMINALNSGANVFMADLEDACAPTWQNVVSGQGHLMDAVRRTLAFAAPDGRRYALADRVATLVVRPRGWHLHEAHVVVDGNPVAASLFDFGLYFFHNARELLDRGTGPYFYLPKLESHLEARLWNDVFAFAQDALGIPRGTIRATVLIETILAAHEMDEILYELRDHAAGLNAGRWDYLFSLIKTFRERREFVLPDRAQVTMAVPFMRAYAQLLVRTCHRREAHAVGGMAAFIPSRRDPEVNARALARVREDKEREAGDGFDGTWVAHPDLVAVAREAFDRVLEDRPHQKERKREDVNVAEDALLDVRIRGGEVTEPGVRTNVSVAIQYLESWLRGIGAVAINNLMEDAATAEISRTQLWQWIRHGVSLPRGGTITAELYRRVRDEELAPLLASAHADSRWQDAAALLDELVLGEFQEFLTIPGYERLVRTPA
ncbi:MAG: malate synthase A [Gemmatimonadaceae bacterium]